MKNQGLAALEVLLAIAILAVVQLAVTSQWRLARARSNLAQVTMDLQTIAAAMEAYRLDYHTYIPGVGGVTSPVPLPPTNAKDGYNYLVHPTAYIRTIPQDPFGLIRIVSTTRYAYYELGSGKQGVRSAGRSLFFLGGSSSDQAGSGYPADVFLLESAGPDRTDDTDNSSSPVAFARESTSGTGEFPMGRWRGLDPYECTPEEIIDVVYDPTNGTISQGQILRSGGKAGDTVTLQTLMKATRD